MQHPAHIPLEKAMGIGQDPQISDLPGPSGCLNFVWALSGVIGPVKKKKRKRKARMKIRFIFNSSPAIKEPKTDRRKALWENASAPLHFP